MKMEDGELKLEKSQSSILKPALRKGYKQTEVGVIPVDWKVSTVGDEFSIQLGKMLDAEKNFGVSKFYLGNRAVQWGRVDLDDLGLIKLTPSDLQRFRLRKGDLLVCEGGEIGRAAIWIQPIEECYYQKALHRLRPLRGFNVQLMLNLLQRMAKSGFLLNFVTQTSIAHLPKEKFEVIPIPLPPTRAEQEAIAEALSDADALIESLEQLIAKKRHIKQGAMQELLTGKKRLPGFNGKWMTGEICNVLNLILDYRGRTPKKLGMDWGGGEIRALSAGNVKMGKIDFTVDAYFGSDELYRKWMTRGETRPNDILLTTEAPLGNVALVPDSRKYILSQRTILLRTDPQIVDSQFLFHTLVSTPFQELLKKDSSGSTATGIQRLKFERINISFPTLPEQSAIATVLSEMDAEIAALEDKLAKARQIKQGMMQELLTGRIRLV